MTKHILILAAIPDQYYFRDLIMAALGQGIQVTLACQDRELHNYRHCLKAGTNRIQQPDFFLKQEWENDPARVERAEGLVRECEQLTRRSLGRILLAGERDLGRGWTSEEYHWFSSKLQKNCLNDTQLPEQIAVRYFGFWDEQLAGTDIDLVLGRANCESSSQALLMLCKLKGIPFLALRNSKSIPKRVYWTDDLLMDNDRGKRLYKEKLDAGVTPSDTARQRLSAFRNTPAPSTYILENWKKFTRQNLFTTPAMIWQFTREHIRFRRKGYQGPPPPPLLSRALELYRIQWYKRTHDRYYQSYENEDLAKLKYAYFPLHKEPELMLNFRSPLWHMQRHTIKYIGSMLPLGFTLLAREHKGNGGRRFTRWLKTVSRFPRTVLVDPYGSQYPYIANADIIITDNGTAGWEGIMLGRPVVTMETTFYDPLDLAIKCTDLNKLDHSIIDALNQQVSQEERDKRVCLFLDAEMETTLDRQATRENMQITFDFIEKILQDRENK